jgi:PAS domain-containing protein
MFIFSTVQTYDMPGKVVTGQYPSTALLIVCSILFTAAIVFALILLFFKQARKTAAASVEIEQLKNQLKEMQLLLDCVADQGKISYVSGVLSEVPENNPVYRFAAIRSESLAPEKKEDFLKSYRQFFSGESKELSVKYSLPVNGQIKEFYDYSKLIEKPDSPVKKFILLTMDISELSKQTRELANADTILNAIFDSLPGHLIMKNMTSDFSYIRCNNSFSALLQMHPSEIVGKTDFDLFDSALAQRIRISDMQLAANRTTADKHWYFTTPDGKDHAIRFISRLLKRPDGSEIIIEFGMDVTRQERLAGKLRKRNKELRMLLMGSSIRSMLLDADLSLACATQSMQQLFPEQQPDAATLPHCRELCSCGITDAAVCPAAISAASGTEQICKYARLPGYLAIKPLKDENDPAAYLAVNLIEKQEEIPGE